VFFGFCLGGGLLNHVLGGVFCGFGVGLLRGFGWGGVFWGGCWWGVVVVVVLGVFLFCVEWVVFGGRKVKVGCGGGCVVRLFFFLVGGCWRALSGLGLVCWGGRLRIWWGFWGGSGDVCALVEVFECLVGWKGGG